MPSSAHKKQTGKRTEKWFNASGVKLHWKKSDGQATRRENALRSRRGNYLKTARALMALSNVNSGVFGDEETSRKARADALYFYRLHKREQTTKQAKGNRK